ncbi:MAG: DUF4855 domain-containing protein [Firmicutes bacterium]|nr:DUF4855 domain-containing protein [Bacillota bacterium]
MSLNQCWKKAIIGISLFLVLTASAPGTSTAAVTDTEEGLASLSWMQRSYLFAGVYPARDDPGRQWVSRRDTVVIGIRLLGLERKAGGSSSPDRYLETAREIGLLDRLGPGTGKNEPGWWDRPASREWTAKWIVTLLEAKKSSAGPALPDYNDSGKITPEFREYVAAARDLGLMSGYPDGSFRPAEALSFDSLARLLTRTAYRHGKGSQIVKGRVAAVIQRNVLISEEGSGKNDWYYLNQWAAITDQGRNIGLEEIAVGRPALLMLHDNREVSNLELLESDAGQVAEATETTQGWLDVADYLVLAMDAPDNAVQLTDPPFAFLYHNLYPIQGPRSVAFDGRAFWVYAPYHRQIFLFDTGGTHRETLEVPEWLKIDTLSGDGRSILAYNQTLNEWYRLRPIYYPLPSSGQAGKSEPAVIPGEKSVPSTPVNQEAAAASSSGPGRYCLLYCGGMGKDELKRYTREEILPLAAYVDSEGRIKKPFFSGFIMLSQYSPLLNGRPLGRDLPELGGGPAGAKDWQAVFDEYFADQMNLDALEATVEEVSKAIGRDDYQVEVYLGIPTPNPKASDWKELSPVGVPTVKNDFRVPEVYAVWWGMQGLYERFQKQGYQHLKLSGFYYQTEQGYPGDTVQESFPLMCRYLGLKSIAIPGVTSSYPLNFKKDGYDTVMIQSSHVFNEPSQRYPRVFLDEASIIAREENTGFLIELPYDVEPVSVRARLYDTIREFRNMPASAPVGCFQGFDYLSRLARSERDLRLVYETVYHAITREY